MKLSNYDIFQKFTFSRQKKISVQNLRFYSGKCFKQITVAIWCIFPEPFKITFCSDILSNMSCFFLNDRFIDTTRDDTVVS